MATFKGAVLSCETCGKDFKVPQCRKKSAKYCSFACAGVGRGKDREIPKVAVTCKECGNIFFEHRCHAGRRVYCSVVCMEASATHKADKSAHSKGNKNGNWSGGQTKHADGYVYELTTNHPFSSQSSNYVFQHRLVAERALRKSAPESSALVSIEGQLYLRPEYVVHHKDEVRDNNRPGNLMVMTNSRHVKLHNALRRKRIIKEQNNG